MCRKMFPKMARLRRRLVTAGPRRKADFQGRVARSQASALLLQVLIMRSSNLQDFRRWNNVQPVHHQFAVGGQRNCEMRQGPGRRSSQFLAIAIEFTSMTRAGDDVVVGLPFGDAAKVRANRRHRKKSLCRADNENLLLPKIDRKSTRLNSSHL